MTHPVDTRSYYVVFAALLVLTATTVGVTYVEMGRFNLIVAMAIAVTKAVLVVLFFMHVRQSSSLTKIVVVAGLFWLALLIALTFSDYLTRDWLPQGSPWEDPKVGRPDILR
jgi:cytochrome c oxidase subunit IV